MKYLNADAAPAGGAPAPAPGATPAPAPSVFDPAIHGDVQITQRVNGKDLTMSAKDWLARASKVEAADQYLATAKENASAVETTQLLRKAIHEGDQDALRKAARNLGYEEDFLNKFFAGEAEPEPEPAKPASRQAPAPAPDRSPVGLDRLPPALSALAKVAQEANIPPDALARMLATVAIKESKNITTSEVEAGLSKNKALQSIIGDDATVRSTVVQLVESKVRERLAQGMQYGPDVVDAAVAEAHSLLKNLGIQKRANTDPMLGIGPGPDSGIGGDYSDKPLTRPKRGSNDGDYEEFVLQSIRENYRNAATK